MKAEDSRSLRLFPVLRWLAVLAPFLASFAAPGLDVFQPIDLRSIRVGGEIGRRLEVTVTNNLLVLDADHDFLDPFRNKTRSDGYIGLGKLLDATVRLAAYTGDPRVDALRRHLVKEVLALQEKDGYLGILAPGHRVKGLWDVHESGYVIWGLLTEARLFQDAEALAAARRAADYVMAHWKEIPPDWGTRSGIAPHVAVTGIERTLLGLYRETRQMPYLDFVINERALPAWDLPIVIGRRAGIEGHIYAYMTRCLAQLEMYRSQPESVLLKQTQRALEFLRHGEGMMITGGAGQCEIWTADQDGHGDLGETCATAYQLRVYDALLRLEGKSVYGDLIERTVYNTLFAAQSPDGRRLRYFSPTDGPRVYWQGDTYCCPCNYRRIVAELPTMVCYGSNRGVVINLFTPCEARLKVADNVPVVVQQQTDYPRTGEVKVRLGLAQPASFLMQFRIPAWARGATISVNGQRLKEAPETGAFHAVFREWKDRDEVTLSLPMEWRLVKGRQRQAGRVAVMRGPQVFCLDPSRQKGLTPADLANLDTITLDPASLGAPIDSDAVRPGGVGCKVKAWRAGFNLDAKPDFELTLTEFPDPAGQATYFRLRDPAAAVDDELLGPINGQSPR